MQPLRALVCLRDGLIADSTRRTIPELSGATRRRNTQAPQHPAAPDHNQAHVEKAR